MIKYIKKAVEKLIVYDAALAFVNTQTGRLVEVRHNGEVVALIFTNRLHKSVDVKFSRDVTFKKDVIAAVLSKMQSLSEEMNNGSSKKCSTQETSPDPITSEVHSGT